MSLLVDTLCWRTCNSWFMTMERVFYFGKDDLTPGIALQLVRKEMKGELSPGVREQVKAGARHVQEIVNSNKTVYGITTGFGEFSNVTRAS